MPSISKGRKTPAKLKTLGNHNEFFNRITKSLYYSKLPMTDRLSLPVTEFAAELFTEVKNGCSLERLDVDEASRISRNACVSPCSFVLALLYLERLKDCNPEYLYKVAPSELFLVSLMIASKYLNDDGEDDEVFNTEWAKSGNLSVPEINKLEREFLNAINWSIYVYDDDFWKRLKQLENHIACNEAKKRGWYSYYELSCLINTIKLTAIVKTLVSISSICLATYTAGIVTLLGSALVASHIPGTSLSSSSSKQPISTTINSTNNYQLAQDDIENLPTIDLSNLATNYQNNENNISKKITTNSNIKCELNCWIDTLTNWLNLNYNNNNSNNSIIEMKNIGTFITDTQSHIDDEYIIEDFITEINWRDTLKDNIYCDNNKDWRYYAKYVAEISLGYQH